MTSNNSKLNGTGGTSNLAFQLPKKNKYSISIYSNPYNINIPFINQPNFRFSQNYTAKLIFFNQKTLIS